MGRPAASLHPTASLHPRSIAAPRSIPTRPHRTTIFHPLPFSHCTDLGLGGLWGGRPSPWFLGAVISKSAGHSVSPFILHLPEASTVPAGAGRYRRSVPLRSAGQGGASGCGGGRGEHSTTPPPINLLAPPLPPSLMEEWGTAPLPPPHSWVRFGGRGGAVSAPHPHDVGEGENRGCL